MNNFKLLSFLLVSSMIVSSLCTEDKPIFPRWNQFSSGFVETSHTEGSIPVVGEYIYDIVNRTTRLSRSNGKYDGFCSGYKNYDEVDAACEHIIVEGDRYMYYPDQEDCCYCCTAVEGCGVMRPNWLDHGEFIGRTTLYGQEAFQWNLDEGEGQPNTLWETTEEDPALRTVIKIYREGYEELFIQSTATKTASKITLPSVCNRSNICPKGDCQFIRDLFADESTSQSA